MADVSADIAGFITEAKVLGSSDNIRHGKYKMLIKRIFADIVETDKGKHKFAFVEMTPIESAPNPQVEGDRVDYVGPAAPGTGPLKDDGTKPNLVGSNCALKVDFDGAGSMSAGANIKAFILGLFGKKDGEVPGPVIDATWRDLARQKAVKAGEIVGFDTTTNQPVKADKDKVANPACGMVIMCTTVTKKKRTPNDKGMYITKLVWSPVPGSIPRMGETPGSGENADDLVAKRRAEIEANMIAGAAADDDEEETVTPPPAAAPVGAAPPPPAPSPPAAPPPPAPFTPPAPWRLHPTAQGNAPDGTPWYWDGGQGVKSLKTLELGK